MDFYNKTVADIVTENYKTADIFKKHRIDFCCGGKISLEEACANKNVDVNIVKDELRDLDNNNNMRQNITDWELDFMTSYIVSNHHNYVKNSVPLLKQYAKKVASVHGGEHPELIDVRNNLFALIKELLPHMDKEEEVLFKYIDEMVKVKRYNGEYEKPMFQTIANPIAAMHSEHLEAGDLMHKINELTDGYTLPQGACQTYTVFFAKLQEFQDDLFQHIHLENNILFPKALRLEKELVDGIKEHALNVL